MMRQWVMTGIFATMFTGILWSFVKEKMQEPQQRENEKQAYVESMAQDRRNADILKMVRPGTIDPNTYGLTRAQIAHRKPVYDWEPTIADRLDDLEEEILETRTEIETK